MICRFALLGVGLVVALAGACTAADPDTQFLSEIADSPSFAVEPGTGLVEVGRAICTHFDNGGTIVSISDIIVEGGYTQADAKFLVGAATRAYCPHHA